MGKGLLSLWEFQTRLAHGCRYGLVDGWPRETILFYKVTVDGQSHGWKKISSFSTTPEHVETRMLKDEILDAENAKGTVYKVDMVQSYSPCRRCSDALIKLQNDFKAKGITIRITILISSFYCISNPIITYNMDGLLFLIKENIILKVFSTEADWVEFLRDVIELPESDWKRWLLAARSPERKDREYVDRCILEDIYSFHHGSIGKPDIYIMGTAAHPADVAQIYRQRMCYRFYPL